MTEREFLSKRHFVRDEIVPGYNDGCRVIPTSHQREQSGEAYRACLKVLSQITAIDRKITALEARDTSMDRLDRAIAALDMDPSSYAALLNARISAARNRPILDDPNAMGLSMGEYQAQYQATYAANQDRICRESEAAYAARNPHTKENAR